MALIYVVLLFLITGAEVVAGVLGLLGVMKVSPAVCFAVAAGIGYLAFRSLKDYKEIRRLDKIIG